MYAWKRIHLLTAVLAAACPVLAGTAEPAPAPDQAAETAPAKKPAARKGKDNRLTVQEATVLVQGRKGADETYRVEAVSAPGPLGAEKLRDIPNVIAIVPATLLENVQATSVKEALKYVPLAQFQEQQGSEVLRPATRGMQGSNYQNTRLDGMTIFITGANALEGLQQIEVFSGLPAAAYGPANPAGMFNFVNKRPTAEPLFRMDFGYDSGSILTAHTDFGGKLDGSEVVSYRVNLLDSHGTAYVTNSELDRKLASLSVDVHPAKDTLLEFNVTKYDLSQKGYPGWFTYNETTNLPKAPDPTRAGYGQPFAGVDLRNQTLDGRLTQNLAPNWVLVVGGLTQTVDRNINTPVNFLSSNGNYTSALANGFAPRFGITSDIAYLNGLFRTGEISHDLTLGTTGFRATTRAVLFTPSATVIALPAASLDNPVVAASHPAGFPDVTDQYLSSVASQQGVNLSDTLGLTRQWSLKLAVSQDWMGTRNYSKTGVQTSAYNKNGLSPMPSLIYKPTETLTTYLTYASSLQQGDIAPAGSANANTNLAPYRSDQWELGAKLGLAKLDATLALFRLERPFAFVDPADNTFKSAGNQVNKGVEASLVGKLDEHLRIISGVTLLDSRMENTPSPLSNGMYYVGMPKVKANLLFEYWLATAPGLVFTADWQYTARRPEDDSNTYWAPAYEVVDLGARYSTKVHGLATTWRLALDNVTDVHYWSTIGPSTITGANTGNLTAHLGAPRTVAASLSVVF